MLCVKIETQTQKKKNLKSEQKSRYTGFWRQRTPVPERGTLIVLTQFTRHTDDGGDAFKSRGKIMGTIVVHI